MSSKHGSLLRRFTLQGDVPPTVRSQQTVRSISVFTNELLQDHQSSSGAFTKSLTRFKQSPKDK